ncbi:sulfatase-like hydrolase/transferase, partial [Pontiella sp.]|uniref:sulfatase-like hydrolase/transferase n=1 Tax=Pontiella sp. TaxID=2837462 RepID=UPI003562A9F6
YGLLTGRYCWRTVQKTGVLGADAPALIPDDRMTLASLLRDQGYATAMIGKWHLGMDIPGTNGDRDFSLPIDDMPLDVGFDYFYGIPASMNFGYLAWIEGRYTAVNPTLFTSKKANTLAGAFSDYRITPPYDQTSGLEVASDFDDILCLTRFTDKAIEWMEPRVDEARAGNPFFIYIPLTSSHKPVIPREDFQGLSAAGAYGDFVMETDYHIGNILKFLDESGLANNTLVIVTSDNGPESTYGSRVSTYGHDSAGIYRGGKRDIYEGGHRVPFVVRWPAGIASPGRVYDKPVCQTDLLATLADLLGVVLDDDSGEDSVSFYDVLRDASAAPTRLPMVHHEMNGRFAVRSEDWKLVMPWEGSGYELYDLSSDPAETNNVYAANPTRAADLEAKLTAIVTGGRTTAGAAVGNDTEWWDDLEWIDEADY